MPRDPLADPKPLIRRVYAYVAYRHRRRARRRGRDERDLRARAPLPRRASTRSGATPIAWLLGIARRCIADAHAVARRRRWSCSTRSPLPATSRRRASSGSTSADAVRTLDAARPRAGRAPLRRRPEGAADRGAARRATNTVEVALHRALEQLRAQLEPEDGSVSQSGRRASVDGSTSRGASSSTLDGRHQLR